VNKGDKMTLNTERLGYIIAEQPKTTIFCVGAGVSARYGLPSWNKLNKNLFERLIKYMKTYNTDKVASLIESEKSISDPWVYGSFIKTNTPVNLYIDWVRNELSSNTILSKTYQNIWSLKVKGVISFNLDNLVLVNSFVPIESQNISHGLLDDNCLRFFIKDDPWVYFPHGNYKRPDGWVFSREQRNLLMQRDSYKRFFTTVSTGYHLVFIGINPKDYSLEDILRKSFPPDGQCYNHFWIKDDPTTDDIYYAKENGLEIINFSSHGNFKELDDILIKLSTYTPRDRNGSFAYFGDKIDPDSLPDDITLSSIPNINEIRLRLNAAAKGLIDRLPPGLSNKEKTDAYIAFTSEYPRSMKLTMLLDPKSAENNKLFGYITDKNPLGGAFGKVYRVKDITTDDYCAVKIMRDDIFTNYELLLAFRRGAEASRILTERHVDGMVKFKGSYEIPPCIFMEYIDGPTLFEFVNERTFDSYDIYKIMMRVCEIVRTAHNLPEGVLHRDLKPQNVMIKDYYVRNCEYDSNDLVLLDFDLSWYKGAIGQSIVPGAGATGYAAPEQYEQKKGRFSAQTAAVDVFGIGMLIYFFCTKKQPYPGMHSDPKFYSNIVSDFIPKHRSCLNSFKSLIAKLILLCTTQNPNQRISVSDLHKYLEYMYECESNQLLRSSNPLVLEEACSTFLESEWSKKDLSDRATQMSHLSKTIDIAIDDSGILTVTYTHTRQGHSDRNRATVIDWLNKKADGLCAAFSSEHHLSTKKEIRIGTFSVVFTFLDKEWNIDKFHTTINKIYDNVVKIND
jgi:eukaryotic-like serine/threonine-protein kinase